MTILWFKALHIFFMVAWFAGIFYLPRLFVYHRESANPSVHQQLEIMERRLFWFVTPFALLTLVFGVALMVNYGSSWIRISGWLHLKLVLVSVLYVYHGWLFVLMKKLKRQPDCYSGRFFRLVNETPVLLLLAIVLLAVLKPWVGN